MPGIEHVNREASNLADCNVVNVNRIAWCRAQFLISIQEQAGDYRHGPFAVSTVHEISQAPMYNDVITELRRVYSFVPNRLATAPPCNVLLKYWIMIRKDFAFEMLSNFGDEQCSDFATLCSYFGLREPIC